MKKILFILLILVTCVQVNAQVSYGVKAGLNINQIVLPSSIGFGSAISNADLGYFAGVSAEYEKNNFIIDCSLLFNNKKGRWEYYKEYDGFDGSLTDNVNYLTLPVTGGYKFQFGEDMKVVCQTGISFNYKLNAYEKFRHDGTIDKWDYNRVYRKFPLGWVITCGIESGRTRFSIGYDIGITSALSTTCPTSSYDGRRAYMRNFIMCFGYQF